ncbi:MAG: amino acid adenylation domain-containing protein, partial [Candidatus Omnitrophota bacterium]
DRLFFTFDYCTKLFVSKTIDRFISYFKRLMGQVLENPDQKVSQLEIIGEEEKKLILHEFNDTRADYPKEKTIHGLFEAQAIKTPDHLAVIGSTGSMVEALHATPLQITYRELNERSGQLAYRLMREGVQADIIVGIKTERSIEMIIGILGILTSGGAYLPIDPDYPQDRIDYILKDSGATVLVTTHEEGQKVRSWEGKQVLFLDSLNLSSSHPLNFSPIFSPLPATAHRPLATSLAYIIYTSGTTGRPKGVLVEHRNVINVVNWFAETHKIGMGTRILQISDFTFDASVNQIFGALISGAAFYIVSADIRLDIEKMRHYIMKHAIHLINFVPSYLRELLCYVDKLENLHTVLSGADRLDDATKDTLIGRGYRLVNQYGPTETTIDALAQECSSEKVNLGKPIANVRVYIWDKYGNVLPIGITGELYIGGAGVSRGYLNNPELTSEKFIRCRLPVPGSRFYKTGDLARWLANGTIEFLGRMDDQVKIRGFRIELGEIEAHLSRHSGIKEAVVIAGNGRGGDKLLCAYVVFEKGHEDSRIKDYLTEELPDYMIPAHFITLDQIPLTPNGKVDRKALPKPGLKSGYRYIAPRNKIENELVNMWSEVLGVDLAVIGIDSNFFELGGHSLKAMALVSKIHKTFDIQMPLAEVLRAPRIRDLAEYIQSKDKEAYSAIEPIEEKEYYELSSAQKRLYVLHHMTVGNIGYNLPHIIPLPEEMEKEKLESVFKQLIQRHESLRTSFTTIDEEPVQRVHDGVDFSIGWYETTEAEAEQLISGFTRPFDLSVAPLLRVNHVGIGSSSRVLVIDMHHIITDGVSQEILKKEFDSLYSGKGELSPLHLQYKDYAEWQNSEIQHTRIQAQENYWLNLFSDEIPVLELPTDYPRPVLQSFEGGTVEFGFSSGETAALKRLATELGVTPYMLILSVLTILLSRLSGQDDIVVGTAIAGRRHADLEQIIGMFVNTLALRNFPRGAMDYKEFLEELKSHTWGAYDHPDYPFEDLVDQLSVTRDIGRNPVFDVMYNFLSREDRVIKTDRGPVELNHRKGTSKFDLTLTALDYGDRLFFTFDYCTKLFVSKTIDRFISYFKRLMGQV